MTALFETWWHREGFAAPPRLVSADGHETLYRVFDGVNSHLFGRCYTLTKPDSVTAAEFTMNVVKSGNRCRAVASFKPRAGTPMWIGRIDQSFGVPAERGAEVDLAWGGFDAQQVWIDLDRARHCLTHLFTHPLRQDKTVVILRRGLPLA